MSAPKSVDDIKHAFYINLTSRPDRKEHVEKQLNTIGIKAERFDAIQLQNGAIGCSMSHLKCLEKAKARGLPYVLIVEDDITFINPELFINQMNKFLKRQPSWDVVLLAGNNAPPYIKIDDYCIKIKRCQTTTGYLVQNHYFDTLINNISSGINLLLKNSLDYEKYAIDRYWVVLQQKDRWYLITPPSVIQREDYSDIEKKRVNYTKIMLDLDKTAFMKQQQFKKMNLT
jgi:glycosyl transferase family 25